MAQYSTDANALLTVSACFREPAMGEATRRGIELYCRVQELIALGGANYSNIGTLCTASGKWRTLAGDQRESIGCYRTVQDALQNGATISTNVSTLKKNAACFISMAKEDQKNLLAFLGAVIGDLNKAAGEADDS
jgi:hypothetical protein